MTSATEVLRRLLDERGVEYKAYELNQFEKTTSWDIDTSDPTHEVCASLEEFDSGTTMLRFWNCTPEQAIAATLGTGTCRDVYLLIAMDIGDGREEVLGVYATEEAATAAIDENQFGYALHHVRKWEVEQ